LALLIRLPLASRSDAVAWSLAALLDALAALTALRLVLMTAMGSILLPKNEPEWSAATVPVGRRIGW
jgi:hypothetical protein